MFGSSSEFPTTAEHVVIKSLCTVQTTKVLGSSRKLGGAAEYLIDGSEKRICRLSFELKSPLVIERHSKPLRVVLERVVVRESSTFSTYYCNMSKSACYILLHS